MRRTKGPKRTVIESRSPKVFIVRDVPRRDLIVEVTLFSLWLVVIAFAIYLTPDPSGTGTHLQLGLAPCPWLTIYSKPCLTCGMTTSFSAIVHGDLTLAFRSHLLGPLVFAWVSLGALYYGSKFLFRYKVIAPTRAVLWINLMLLGAFLAYGGWRMLP